MKKTHILRFLICIACIAAIILVFASCGSDGATGKKEADYDGERLDDLPTDLDFGGEQVNIFHLGSKFIIWELTSDGTTADIVEKAVAERNDVVQKRLGITLNYIAGDVAAEVFMPTVRDEVMSGSTDYDLILGPQCEAVPVAAAGAFTDLHEQKYLDLTKDYWNASYNEALSVNEKRFLVGGDASLSTTAGASCMAFHMDEFRNKFGDEEEFYQFVYAGNWTIDELAERCKVCYEDLNGNGVKDASDLFGMGYPVSSSCTDQYCFSSGVKWSYRDESDTPVLDIKNDKTLEFVDKFFALVYNNEGVYPYTDDEAPLITDDMNTVFFGCGMQSIVEMRGEEKDFGVIPMPKLDENEEMYHSWISDGTGVWGVPITLDTDRVERACAVLECFASETKRLCLPQYFERALKNKYVRDSWSAKMLDLIHDGETTDFCAIINFGFMRGLMAGGTTDVISTYDSLEPKMIKTIQELFDAYDKNTTGTFVPETTTTASESELENLDIADNQISTSWLVFGTKYKKSGVYVKPDWSDKFAYVINENDEIEVRSPDIKVAGGYYPTAAIESRETIPLTEMNIAFHIDDGFTFSTEGWASSFSLMWTDEAVSELPYYLEGPGTNGLRETVAEETTGLSVIFMGSQATSGTTADYLYIVLYDGLGTRPEIDNRIGWRFTNVVDHDLAQPTTVEVKEDDELGYVVSVNGVEYREGMRGKETYPIDLNILKDVEEGYLTIGGESNDASFSNFTVSTINGKGAGSYFD